MQNVPVNRRSATPTRASLGTTVARSTQAPESNPVKRPERLERDRDYRARARDRDGLFECTRLLQELTRDGSLTRRERAGFDVELAKLSSTPNGALILELRASLRRLYTL